MRQYGSATALLTAAASGVLPRDEASRDSAPSRTDERADTAPAGCVRPSAEGPGSYGLLARRRAPAALLDLAAALGLGVDGLLDLARSERDRAGARGFRILTILEDDYPALLREIPDPPPVLYIWGTLEPDDEVRLAIVGSRRASRYGVEVAGELASRLSWHGLAVVSGLARGIDAAAHRGTLDASGRTLAVLGSGLEKIYPRENSDLARQIAERGAVLSEYPLDLGPLPQLFPRRNRVISGLSAGVVVVEAAAESGALGTARLALDQGREVYSVPGEITAKTSVGTNRLLNEGVAHIVTRAHDVLKELPPVFRLRLGLTPSAQDEGAPPWNPGVVPLHLEETGPSGAGDPERPMRRRAAKGSRSSRAGADAPLLEEGDLRIVWKQLGDRKGTSLDDLTLQCGLPVPRLLAAVSTLELRGFVESMPGGKWARSRRFV